MNRRRCLLAVLAQAAVFSAQAQPAAAEAGADGNAAADEATPAAEPATAETSGS